MLAKRRASAANKCSEPRRKASLARSSIADYDVIDDDDFYHWRPQGTTPTRPNWFNDRQKVGYLATPRSRYVFCGKPPTRTVPHLALIDLRPSQFYSTRAQDAG